MAGGSSELAVLLQDREPGTDPGIDDMNLTTLFLLLFLVMIASFVVMAYFSGKMATIRRENFLKTEARVFQRMPFVALGVLMDKGDYSHALEKIEEMLATDPLNPALFHFKINCLFHMGKHQEALSFCDHLLEHLFKEDAGFAAKKAELLLEMGAPGRVKEIVEDWLVRHPLHPRLLIVSARLALFQGDREAAKELLKGVLERDMGQEIYIRSVCAFREDGFLEELAPELENSPSPTQSQ